MKHIVLLSILAIYSNMSFAYWSLYTDKPSNIQYLVGDDCDQLKELYKQANEVLSRAELQKNTTIPNCENKEIGGKEKKSILLKGLLPSKIKNLSKTLHI